MSYTNLMYKIPTDNPIDYELINNWNTVIEELKTSSIHETITINGVTAEKYRADMEGLFRNLGIIEKFIYPHIRVNGYNSSREFLGEKLNIKLLDNQQLEYYYQLFTT